MTIRYLLTMKITAPLSLILSFVLFACKENKQSFTINESISQSDAFINTANNNAPYESDTAIINKKKFVLSVIKTDTDCYFKVEKEIGPGFKTILIDRDYNTNNSTLLFKDQNNDGFEDIVWTKKWQDHSYLFNPSKENFYEVGEFHDINTLKIKGQPVLYKNKYPVLWLQNPERDMEWMIELHAELFTIDSAYNKISFATIDDLASQERWNIEKCARANSVVVNCYVPPYSPKYGELSVWNSGKSIDSLYMKANKFDSAFIAKYWIRNYRKLLPYGKIFHARRATELEYY